jgi:hypothetical protein
LFLRAELLQPFAKLDPTGPPSNTGDPVAAYALYAEHDGSTWSAYLAGSGTHTPGYIGQGTHATYPIRCAPEYGDYCGLLEASYDGVYPWGRNDSQECGTGCVIRFGTAPWLFWSGKWGMNEEGALPGGGSPDSPGNQSRFLCALRGYDSGCPTPPFAGAPALRTRTINGMSETTGGPAVAASVCAAWEGENSAVTVCQPDVLRRAIRQGTLDGRIKPNLKIPGFRGRISAARGITQAIGQPLVAGQQAIVRGALQPGSEIAVRVRVHTRRWVAWFKLPRLSQRSTAKITIRSQANRPSVVIHFPGRKLLPQRLALQK